MMHLKTLLSNTVIEAIGWTLFHSIWQATIVLIALFLLLTILKKSSSQTRYLVAAISMIAIVVWSGITFTKSYQYSKEKAEVRAAVLQNPEQIKELIKLSVQEKSATESKLDSNQLNKIRFRAFMQRHYPTIFLIWLIGIMFFLIKMAGSLYLLNQLKGKYTTPVPERFKELLQLYQTKLKFSKPVELLQSATTSIPMVIGYLKPVVLLPASLLTGMDGKQIEAIIAHEVAHIKRHDYLVNIIQSVLETIFFFHPAVWVISSVIRNERESACDEIAIELTSDKITYLKALTKVQELDINKNNYQIAFAGAQGGLLNRVIKIKNLETMKKNVTEGFIAATIIFLGLILVSFSFDGYNLKSELPDNKDKTELANESQAEDNKLKTLPKVSKDSIQKVTSSAVEELEDLPEEMEQLIEVAYTNNDIELAELISENVRLAMEEVKFSEIMVQVDSALKEANINAEIQMAMAEAKAELARESSDSAQIALEALEIAASTLEAVNIEEIVSLSMESAALALESLNLSEIISEAMQEVTISLEEADIEGAIQEAFEAEKTAHYNQKELEDVERDLKKMEEDLKKLENEESQKDSARLDQEKKLEEKLKELENEK